MPVAVQQRMALTRNLSSRTFGVLRSNCHFAKHNICFIHGNPVEKTEVIPLKNTDGQDDVEENIDDKTRISTATLQPAGTKKPHSLVGHNKSIIYQRNYADLSLCSFIRKYSSDSGNNSDSEEVKIYLDAVSQPIKPVQTQIVAGKGPPPEPPIDCCMSGCANCVWIQYAEELKTYFTENEGLAKAKEAIETIDNPGLQMFLKLELGLL